MTMMVHTQELELADTCIVYEMTEVRLGVDRAQDPTLVKLANAVDGTCCR
jgi:hypothetical protein